MKNKVDNYQLMVKVKPTKQNKLILNLTKPRYHPPPTGVDTITKSKLPNPQPLAEFPKKCNFAFGMMICEVLGADSDSTANLKSYIPA